ncbi:MAG TPA: hypothetical protein VJQ44_14725 [Gemmatimonadales bacterium]|nr:hypothetical protein [Gemmatimonadales bacterium]
MRAPLAAAALAIFGAAPLAAQVDFRNLDEGRPVRTEDALPVDHYGLELTLPYTLEAEDEVRLHLTTPELVYGLRPGGEIGVSLPIAALDDIGGTTWAVAGARLFGLQTLAYERPGAPALALRADLILPVGGFAGDDPVLALKAIATRSWGPLRAHLNASVTPTSDEPGPAAEPEWSAGLAVDRTFFRSSVLLLGELGALEEPGADATEATVAAGARYQLTPTLVLDAGLRRRLGSAGPDLGLTLGLSHAFSLAALHPHPPRQPPARPPAPRQDEQFYLPGSFNWSFLARYPEAARLFNAFDYGHAVLYELLLTQADSADAALAREYGYLTRDLLVRPPRLGVAEEVVMPRYAREIWQAKQMFDWAHVLHRQIYDVYADDRLTPAERDSLVERLTDRYLARVGTAFVAEPKSMTLMEEQAFSRTFRGRQPAFNGLIWAYHWLQVGLYEPLVRARTPAEAKSGIAAAVSRFWGMVATERYPRVMPMTAAIAPEFSRRHPRAAAIFDNLHMMHDIISDVLASADIPRERKREVIAAQLAEFRTHGRNILSPGEWRAMAGQMGGVDAMGGPAFGPPVEADSAPGAPGPMEHHHH